mgnify:CR=1 FL=1
MGFSINDFAARLNASHGINHGNHFDVRIYPSWDESSTSGYKFKELLGHLMHENDKDSSKWTDTFEMSWYDNVRFFCRSASIPTKDISTSDWSAYGPMGKFPYESSHGDLELEILITNNKMFERKFFESWLNMIEHSDNHTIGWHANYTSNIEVHILTNAQNVGYTGATHTDLGNNRTRSTPDDHDGYRIGTINVKDAFPISLSEIALNYDNEGLQTFSTTITYDQYAFKGAPSM